MNDTLLFFGFIYRDGHEGDEAGATIDRLAAMHERFPIPPDDFRYTTASLCFEAVRIPEILGCPGLTDGESRALFLFWRAVGRRWGIANPEEQADFRAWMERYEAAAGAGFQRLATPATVERRVQRHPRSAGGRARLGSSHRPPRPPIGHSRSTAQGLCRLSPATRNHRHIGPTGVRRIARGSGGRRYRAVDPRVNAAGSRVLGRIVARRAGFCALAPQIRRRAGQQGEL